MQRSGTIIFVMTVLIIGLNVVPTNADELSDALAKQRQLEKVQQQAKSQLNNLKITENLKKEELDQIVRQITLAESNLAQKELAYAEAQADVETAEKKLQAKEQELNNRRQALRYRVRGIYEEGQLNYLDVLFQSANLGDFIVRIEYFQRLVENDQLLLAEIDEKKKQVEKQSQVFKEERDKAAALKERTENAKRELVYKKEQQQKAIAEIKQAEYELFSEIEKFEKDSKQLEDTIRRLQAGNKNGVIGTIRVWPLPGYTTVSSAFGWRIHPITGKRSLHTGIDIPAPAWTKLLAAGEGTVIYSGWYSAVYGNAVIIDHGNGMSTMYPHQVQVAVKKGDIVKAGQTVGYVGSTGWSTGPHTHFEVRKNGAPVDPLQFFR